MIYVGSLSKSLAPGLRLGYIVASRVLMRELRGLRRLMLRQVPVGIQRAFALFVALGHHDALMRRTSQSYASVPRCCSSRWHFMCPSCARKQLQHRRRLVLGAGAAGTRHRALAERAAPRAC